MPTTYHLTLTPDQARIVSRACDFYARVLLGQFDEIAFETMIKNVKRENFSESYEAIRRLLSEARRIAFPMLSPPNQTLGVGDSDLADSALNVRQVLRHAIACHEHPEGGVGYCFDEPVSYNDEPLPKVSVEETA